MLKKLLIAAGITIVITVAVLLAVAAAWTLPGEELTPAGYARNASHYVPMTDGVELAVDVWLPEDLKPGERLPSVVEATRYWRSMGLTAFGRVAAMFGVALPGVMPDGYARYFTGKRYAYVRLDVRGTGASYGVHTTEYSAREIEDFTALFDWLAAQPWSSGQIFATGVSYGGTLAELMTSVNHPALKAVAPLYSDFDPMFQLSRPGGVMQPAFIDAWSDLVGAMDRNDLCAVMAASDQREIGWWECFSTRFLLSGVKAVPERMSDLQEAISAHDSPNVRELVRGARYRDSGPKELRLTYVYESKAKIEASATPMFVVAGWHDAATANGALARFATFSNPQSVWIGPFDHGGSHDADPFRAVDAEPIWSGREQLDRVEAFFRAHTDGTADNERMLNYFVLGSGQFRQTDVWPPAHLDERYFHLHENGQLSEDAPTNTGYDAHTVDFASSTAPTSRWMTQFGGLDVAYDLDEADGIAWTSSPMTAPTELTGSPVLDFWMTSTQPDGALHAYLDAVSPSGEVRYLTEGVLLLSNRALTRNPAYPVFGPAHSFLEADAEPLPTGKTVRITTTLFATSALIPEGYRLRLRLTGADAASFARVPAAGEPPVWHIYRGPTKPSSITLQTAPWDTAG